MEKKHYNNEITKCPICGQEVGAYHEVTFKEPYVHNSPFDGIMIYGAFSSPKETICFENNYLHFAFYDSENNLVDHRLVQLGVEVPATESPSAALAGAGDDDYDDDYSLMDDDGGDWDHYDPYEDEEFPNGSLDY
jgi:hypothetical protein